MNWEQHKEKLAQGETVQFRPKGNSMQPKINSGNLVTVEPVDEYDIEKGDIVFCKVKGSHYVHLVTATQQKMGGVRFQISNNKGRTNGWIGYNAVFGKVVRVEE
jgi:SOS-response transcriptional repressor LexA